MGGWGGGGEIEWIHFLSVTETSNQNIIWKSTEQKQKFLEGCSVAYTNKHLNHILQNYLLAKYTKYTQIIEERMETWRTAQWWPTHR